MFDVEEIDFQVAKVSIKLCAVTNFQFHYSGTTFATRQFQRAEKNFRDIDSNGKKIVEKRFLG